VLHTLASAEGETAGFVTPQKIQAPDIKRRKPANIKNSGPLLDRWGRIATDLRISLTDKCNLRCIYCMPAEGLQWLPKNDLLTADEIARLADIAIRELGVEEIRFTGGEPLVRADLVDIIGLIHAMHPQVPLAITTNGIGLEKRAEVLAKAGLARINVSLDTICPETFAELTRRDKLDAVLRGIDGAAAAGLHPIKINAVLMPGLNDTQAPQLLKWALAGGYQPRVIEQMPLGPRDQWDRSAMVTAQDIIDVISTKFDLTPDTTEETAHSAAPATMWRISDGDMHGKIGIIASVTRPFCGACDRTRLTSDGAVRSCLFSQTETSLRDLLRQGRSDNEIAEAWAAAMWLKPAGHGIDDPSFVQPHRPMSAIGG